MTSPAASRRDRFNKRFYPVPHPETHEIHDLPAWSRLKSLLANGGVETWKLKNVAREVAMRPDLQMLAGDPSGEYAAVQQALDASRGPSNAGTAIHRYAEYIDDGSIEWDRTPVAARPWLEAYAEAKERFGWTMVETEVTVANLTLGYAGTADRFANIPGLGVVPFDIKTGKDVWPETALQLAAYSGAEFIWRPPADSELPNYFEAFKALSLDIARGENFKQYAPRARKWSEDAKKKAYATLDDQYWEEFALYPGHRPLPEGLRTDLGVVALLHADGCELIPLKLEGALDVIGGLCTVWEWDQRGRDVVGEPLAAGSDPVIEFDWSQNIVPDWMQPNPDALQQMAVRSDLVGRIQELPSLARQHLATLWPGDLPTLKASRDHTTEQLAQIDGLLRQVESNQS